MDSIRKDLNYYDLLEVAPNATQREINEAFKRAKVTYSNDNPALYTMFTREEATELMCMIEEAHEILSNNQSRQFYDQQLRATHPELFKGEKSAPAPMGSGASVKNPTSAAVPSPTPISARAPQPSSGGVPAGAKNVGASMAVKTSLTGEKIVVQEKSIQFEDGFVSVIRTKVRQTPQDGYGQTLLGPYKLDSKMEEEIQVMQDFDGHALQRIRNYKNVSLDQLSGATKVTRTYLEAVEKMDLTVLPAPVFVRGFVGHIARILGLDEKKVCDSYMKALKQK